MSSYRACMCDLCGRTAMISESGQHRGVGWAQIAIDVRAPDGPNPPTRKMDLCCACLARFDEFAQETVSDEKTVGKVS